MLQTIVSLLSSLLIDAAGGKDEIRAYLIKAVTYLKNNALRPRMKVFYTTVLWALNNDILWDVIWGLLPVSGIVGASPEEAQKVFDQQLLTRKF